MGMCYAHTCSFKEYRSRNTGARTVRLARRYNDIGNDDVISEVVVVPERRPWRWKGAEGIERKPVSRRSAASVDDTTRNPTFHKSVGLL